MENEVRHGISDIFPAQEAVFDDETLTAKVTIIREGMNMSRPRKNYTKAALKQAVQEGIFNNLRMFVDHSNKPPIKRSIAELMSGTGITSYEEESDGKGKIVAPVTFFKREFYDFAKQAKEHMGTSINTMVRGTRFRAPDGIVQEDIHGFVPQAKHNSSVDWVVFPSAGGKIESFITAQEGVDVEDLEWDKITPEMVKEHAPELYSSIIAAAPKPEVIPATEGTDDDGDTLKLTAAEFQAKVQEAVSTAVTEIETKRANQVATRRQIEALVDASALPALTKARVKASFDGAESFDETKVQEAITTAQAEVKAIAGPKVSGMGVTRPDGDDTEFVGPAREAVESMFDVPKAGASSNAGKDKE